MQQFQAGYFVNGIFDLFINQSEKEKIRKIVQQLCYFDLETKVELKHKDFRYSADTKIVNNLITNMKIWKKQLMVLKLFSAGSRM